MSDDPKVRAAFGHLLRAHVCYQDGAHSAAPSLVFADADYEEGDGKTGLHEDGKSANEPAIVYVRGDAFMAQAARIAALEAQLAEAVEALEGLIPVLEAIMKEEGRGIEWGEEDPFRMGEWFEDEDRHQMARARAFLIAAHLQRREA